jgi:hypothetical protein
MGMGMGGMGGGAGGGAGGEDGIHLGDPSGGAIIQYNPAFNAEFEHLLRAVGGGPPPGGVHGLDVTQALGGLQLNHAVRGLGGREGQFGVWSCIIHKTVVAQRVAGSGGAGKREGEGLPGWVVWGTGGGGRTLPGCDTSAGRAAAEPCGERRGKTGKRGTDREERSSWHRPQATPHRARHYSSDQQDFVCSLGDPQSGDGQGEE